MSPPVLGEWATVDVLKLEDGSWNKEVVRQAFSVEEADAILSLPSGYRLARNPTSNPSVSRNFETLYQPQIAEAMAIVRGLQVALETSLVPTSLETDTLLVVKMIDSHYFLCTDLSGI
ncbi:hypothetical protein Ddye_030210 [Dipteronia dyeriana]|uniref:RNase H type-1 domain-containing protein n=1 Tax=Dipteronia dyeriana TaxID=168575 RepID=A0AAD9WMJ0_9ROSI|nr:hypothetical protein Ddye_030210 [Dipteronia dyeriana]